MKTQSTKQAVGHFSPVSGSQCRHVYSPEGILLGVIFKREQGGYRVQRMDGKIRIKDKLSDAFKSIRRAN